jgi:hypothetical protein
MPNDIKICRGNEIEIKPRSEWIEALLNIEKKGDPRTAFLKDNHRKVRYYLVEYLPKIGKPISSISISEELNIPLSEVECILDELLKNTIFILRDGNGDVTWAFPVTIDKTPHRFTFNTGEVAYGA